MCLVFSSSHWWNRTRYDAKRIRKLKYGNCDISDWSGKLNTNNDNPLLTGFWIESSLLISPKEQVEVMEHIFGDDRDYSQETVEQLKQVMLLSELNDEDTLIYGKTGMGKDYGITVDSWFTGFCKSDNKKVLFFSTRYLTVLKRSV